MDTLYRLVSPIPYLVTLIAAVVLSVLLFDASVSMIGNRSLGAASGVLNVLVNAVVVGLAIFLAASLTIGKWCMRWTPGIIGHLWRCIFLYGFFAICLVSIVGFTVPSYRNPGIGGFYAVTIFISSLCGIAIDLWASRSSN
ncbi:MAG: hypothetical protein ACI87W_003227 [Halieaceae bacterium]|jgi:hypothetical protein